MAPPNTFELYDRLVFNGGLADWLLDCRSRHEPYESIVRRLREKGVIASASTVHRWVHTAQDAQ